MPVRYPDAVTRLDIEIRPLVPADTATYVAFLGRDAFTDHPEWAGCFCYFPHADHEGNKFSLEAVDENREAASAMVASGTMRGYFACVDGQPVAWCNANLLSSYTIFDEDASTPGPVGAIGCFVVVDRFRRKGIARRLLDAAVEGFRAAGVKQVVAWPRKDAESEAENHLGPLSLYLAAGFEIAGEQGRNIKVRKRL